MFALDKVLSLIVNPPIVPPVNCTLLPVTFPFALTLNFDDDIKKSLPVADPDIKKLSPLDNLLSLIVKPPILPPVNNTLLPVTSPFPLILNLLELIKNWVPVVAEPEIKTPEPVIASRVIANPPIFPVVALMLPVTDTEPLNRADDAVTSPEAFTLNLLELIKKSLFCADPEIKNPDPVIAFWVISNPPILPVAAVIFPDIVTLPAASKLKFEELITSLPLLPLMYWLLSPKKNLGVTKLMFDPDIVAWSETFNMKELLPNDIWLLSSFLNKNSPDELI